MSFLSRASRHTLALVVAGALAVPATTLAAASATADVEPPVFQPVGTTEAEQALARAESLLRPAAGDPSDGDPTARSTAGSTAGGADATLALRDLALALPQLDRSDQRIARALLARPNGGRQGYDAGATWAGPEAPASVAGKGCSTIVPLCVHWTNNRLDAPRRGDDDGDGVPNQVERTVAVMEQVWAAEVDTMGYRAPLTDERASIDADGVNFDVYLSDIGGQGLYGYCAPDDSRTTKGSHYKYFDVAAYCVLDDDYAEFRTNTPIENLRVTAAHEFFHAIQFAYDALEDAWFMEGTAAWIEDEVYTTVNDNRQYLAASQFNRPRIPLDTSHGIAVYGSWGFWRYLSETFGQGVVRSVWERADASPGGPDDYSLRAVRRALGRNFDVDLTSVLGDFGLAIAAPATSLLEGAGYPSALVDSFRLTHRGDSTGWKRYTLDHLSYAPVRFVPAATLGSHARLVISLDLPPAYTAPVARLLVVDAAGAASGIRRIQLDRSGAATVRLPFAPGDVQRVLLTVGNASERFTDCYTGKTQFSCYGGTPRHDDLRFEMRATIH